MYIVTDINAITAEIDNKAPRNPELVLREMYPGCTIDKNGRAHAPCDGYVCTMTDAIYRGGEYLPQSEEAVVGGNIRRMYAMNAITGEDVIFEGTKAQISAAATVAKLQQTAFDATRQFVGTVKARVVLTLRICAVFGNVGMYGTEYTHYMRDSEMNPVVYKGTKVIGNVGGDVTVKATIKSHWATPDGGRKATYIARPATV
jgi:hypothetical protein